MHVAEDGRSGRDYENDSQHLTAVAEEQQSDGSKHPESTEEKQLGTSDSTAGRVVDAVLKNLTAQYLAKIISMPVPLVVARILGPQLYGVWTGVRVILSYSTATQVGTLQGMMTRIPYQQARGDTDSVANISNTVLKFNLITAGAGAILVLLASFILRHRYEPVFILALQAAAILIFCKRIYAYHGYLLRAENRFGLLSRVIFLYGLLNAAFKVSLVMLMNIYGLFLSEILTYVVIIMYIRRNQTRHYSSGIFDFKILMSSISVGLPLMLAGFAHTLHYTIDRLIVGLFLGSYSLGLYGFAMLIENLLGYIPTTIHQVLFPRIMAKISVAKDVAELKRFWYDPLNFLAHTITIPIGIAWLGAPLLIKYILPKYADALDVFRIISVSMYFISMPVTLRLFLIAMNKQTRLVFFSLAAIGINAGLSTTLIRTGYGIEGVAIATGISFFALGNGLLVYALSHLKRESRNTMNVFISLHLPFLYMICLLFLTDRFIAVPYVKIHNDILHTMIQMAAYMVLILPLLYLEDRQTGILRRACTSLMERVRRGTR
jgi:O-antigen/teichoic acid export membrane protein